MELARTKYGRSAGLAQVMGETGRFGNTPELTLAQNLHLSSPLLKISSQKASEPFLSKH